MKDWIVIPWALLVLAYVLMCCLIADGKLS